MKFRTNTAYAKKGIDGPYLPLKWTIDLDDLEDRNNTWIKHDLSDTLTFIRYIMQPSDDIKPLKDLRQKPQNQIQDYPEILKLLEDD